MAGWDNWLLILQNKYPLGAIRSSADGRGVYFAGGDT
jgi:hypothetical protein